MQFEREFYGRYALHFLFYLIRNIRCCMRASRELIFIVRVTTDSEGVPWCISYVTPFSLLTVL